MLNHLRLACAMLLFATPAAAQDLAATSYTFTPPGVAVLSDFTLYATLDRPLPFDFVPQSNPLTLGGWAFDCRSGLQPSTQRVGDVAVRFVNVNTNQEFLPDSVKVVFGERPDVYAAFASSCPALGKQAGMSVIVKGLPPPNMYRMELLIDTFDYAGRYAAITISRTIIVTSQ